MRRDLHLNFFNLRSSFRRFARLGFACALLAGCGSSSNALTSTGPSSSPPPEAQIPLSGSVYGGQQPISTASIYIFSFGNMGYGSAGTSQLNTAAPGVLTDSNNNGYVQTASDGTFTLSGDYATCADSTPVYILALGGNPGLSGGTNNTAIALMTSVGTCAQLRATTSISINEVTTVAAAYSLAQFGSAAANTFGTSSSNGQGLTNAIATIGNLVNRATGVTPATITTGTVGNTGTGTIPQSKINALGNALAACVNTAGPTSTGCTELFADTYTGATNTLQAIVYLAQHPTLGLGSGSASLVTLGAPNIVFSPTLSANPTDWTLSILYSGAGINDSKGVAVDGTGNVWLANYNATGPVNTLSELSPIGAPISPSGGYSGIGLNNAYALAIDATSSTVWVSNTGASNLPAVSTASATPISGSPFTGGGLDGSTGVSIGPDGDVWLVNQGNGTVSKFSSVGAVLSGSSGTAKCSNANITGSSATGIAVDSNGNAWVGGRTSNFLVEFTSCTTTGGTSTSFATNVPLAMAVDHFNNVWVANNANNTLSGFTNVGAALTGSPYSGGGLNGPDSVAVDGKNNVWVANGSSTGGVSEFTNAGAAVSTSNGFAKSLLAFVHGIAVDGSGNLWMASSTTTSVGEIVGAAAPVITPLAKAIDNNSPASIASFAATPATITSGTSSSLSAVFSGGTGVITGGGSPIGVTSGGTPINVSPTATTTYTLTVTPPTGSPVTATVTVTVVPPPTITSFTASPESVTAGSTSNLTAIFANGVGVITPGNLAVTSGTAVPVTPSTITTYTLTVTSPAGLSVWSTITVQVPNVISATVTVNPSSPTTTVVTDQILGMNLSTTYDVPDNASAINTAFGQAGIKTLRWPGGAFSDVYHWGQGGAAPSKCVTPQSSGTSAGYGTFAQFVTDIVQAGHYDLALTANYGTDSDCTGPGVPSEAAAWAAAALTDGVTVSYMTIGNEQFNAGESDLHTGTNQHNPTVYAGEVAGTNGYYNAIKTASPNTKVGVIVEGNNTQDSAAWDSAVLSTALGYYDFVEFHYYPETPTQQNDATLLQVDAHAITQHLNVVKQELATAGAPNTPIYVGEVGGPGSNLGVQSWSIVQGLYAGEILGELMSDGIPRATWWMGFGNCLGRTGDMGSSLYGWQDFGSYNVFADGPGEVGPDGNPCDYGGPIGTMSPTARAFQLFSNVAVDGEHVLTPTVTGDTTNIRAYAATATHLSSTGTALVLFNLSESASERVTVTATGQTLSSDVRVITYDKSIYDQTSRVPPVWAAPNNTDMGQQTLPLTLTLTPWSMNVVLIK